MNLAHEFRCRGLTKWYWLMLLLQAAYAWPGLAADAVTVRSRSGQFVVRGIPVGTTYWRSPTSSVEYVRLDPALTAVSLDRIRQVLLGELRLPEAYQGSIQVTTHPLTQDVAQVRIASVRYTDRWGYRVDLPERLEKTRFLSVAVEVILMEIANRRAVLREAELPPWLAPGLAAELLADSLPTLALEPGAAISQRDRRPDPLKLVRELLRQRPALRFDELGQGTVYDYHDEEAVFYRSCAHVFVHALLRLRGGREGLRETLTHLSDNLNWQTTFLQCFSNHFNRLIDVDKWYTLNAVNLSGRDVMSAWPLATTLRQLDDVLSVPVQVRLEPDELPIHTRATLTRILAEWDFERQQPVLRQTLQRLQALRSRAALEALELVDEYVRVLHTYTFGRDGKATTPARRSPAQFRLAVNMATRQLTELEERRRTLQDTLAGTGRRPPP